MPKYPFGALDYLYLRENLPPIQLTIDLEEPIHAQEFVKARSVWLSLYPRLRSRVAASGQNHCVFRVETMKNDTGENPVRHAVGSSMVKVDLLSETRIGVVFSHLLGDLKTCKFYLHQLGRIIKRQSPAPQVPHETGTDLSSPCVDFEKFGYLIESEPYKFVSASESFTQLQSSENHSSVAWMTRFLTTKDFADSIRQLRTPWLRLPVDTRQRDQSPSSVQLGNFIIDAVVNLEGMALDDPKAIEFMLRKKIASCNQMARNELEQGLNAVRETKGWQIFENFHHPGLRLVSTKTSTLNEEILGPVKTLRYQTNLPEENSVFFFPRDQICQVKAYL